MVTRDRFGALKLLPSEFAHADGACSGTVLADAMRSAYLYAQTQGRLAGIQVYTERTTNSVSERYVLTNDFAVVARVRKHLPVHARAVFAHVGFTCFGDESGGDSEVLVHHRMRLSYGGDEDLGPEFKESGGSISNSVLQIHPGTDSTGVDPGETGVFSEIDRVAVQGGIDRATCFAEISELTLDDINIVVIEVEAYATQVDPLVVVAEDSARVSDVITADVPDDHGFYPGLRIWTDGFDVDVPEASPVEITFATDDTLSWVIVGLDGAPFGNGTIYSAEGQRAVYKPHYASIWWEV